MKRRKRSGRRTKLLRAYDPGEAGKDGYPFVWHHESGLTPRLDRRITTRDLDKSSLSEILPAIKDLIREQAGHRCQRCGHPYAQGGHAIEETPDGAQLWSPCDSQCRHPRSMHDSRWRRVGRADWLRGIPTLADVEAMEENDYEAFEVEALWRVLTVHHLDEDKLNCRWWNLTALCQRCHLRMQRAVVMGRPYHFEHSEWFKPHAAGFYAWKYLGEDLDREATMARLDELLALEHRFTQEALL